MKGSVVLGRFDIRQLAVVLDLVLELGELVDNGLALARLVRVVALGYGSVCIINGLCDDDRPSFPS